MLALTSWKAERPLCSTSFTFRLSACPGHCGLISLNQSAPRGSMAVNKRLLAYLSFSFSSLFL